MNANADVILVRADGALILQHRDDKPGITNPGAVTSFGGGVEPGETPAQTVLREINEETNLNLVAGQLTFWRKYHKTKAIHGEDWDVYYFIARNISEAGLEIYEGQGFIVVNDPADTTKLKLSVLFREALTDYYAEFDPIS